MVFSVFIISDNFVLPFFLPSQFRCRILSLPFVSVAYFPVAVFAVNRAVNVSADVCTATSVRTASVGWLGFSPRMRLVDGSVSSSCSSRLVGDIMSPTSLELALLLTSAGVGLAIPEATYNWLWAKRVYNINSARLAWNTNRHRPNNINTTRL